MKLTKRLIDTLQPRTDGKDRFEWDDDLAGFGVRMKPSGSGAFVIQYKIRGRTRRLKIASLNSAPEQARIRAKVLLAQVASGSDPSQDRHDKREELIVAQLCALYLEAADAALVTTRFRKPKRASTIATDHGRVRRHILPLIGGRIANSLTRIDIQRLHDAVAGGKTRATIKTRTSIARVTGGAAAAERVVGLFGGVWTWAERLGYVQGVNPVHGVVTQKGEPSDRVLSADELARLGSVVRERQALQPQATGALRLIALSGLRRQEACTLRWPEVDAEAGCLRLSATKSGRQIRPIGSAALRVLAAIPQDASSYVFPNVDGSASADLKRQIASLFDAAGLKDARCHDLRRTFASVASETFGDGTISELLGHARDTAQRYIRRPDKVLVSAADTVSERISAMMDGKVASVSPLRTIGKATS